MPRILTIASSLLTTFLFLSAAPAQAMIWYGGEFSADIVMTNPQDPNSKATGKMFVGNGMIRAEGSHNGEQKVVLILSAQKQAYTLIPAKKQFYQGVGDAPMPPSPDEDLMPDSPESPCKSGQQGVTCQMLGQEAVGGRNAQKWQITMSAQGQQRTVTLWADPVLKVVLRKQDQSGYSTERTMVGNEQVNGRNTEKWEVVETFKDKTLKFTKWVDRKLKATVRMLGEGQFSADLTNIQEGPQPATLFQMPAGFQQVQPPQPPQQPQQQQQQQPQR